jgi:hypothetical protein
MSRQFEQHRQIPSWDEQLEEIRYQKELQLWQWKMEEENPLESSSRAYWQEEASKGELNRSYVNFSATQNYPTP